MKWIKVIFSWLISTNFLLFMFWNKLLSQDVECRNSRKTDCNFSNSYRHLLILVKIMEDFFRLAQKNTVKNVESGKLSLYIKAICMCVARWRCTRVARWIHPAEKSEVPLKNVTDYSEFQLAKFGQPSPPPVLSQVAAQDVECRNSHKTSCIVPICATVFIYR